jgi:hypothetical protein
MSTPVGGFPQPVARENVSGALRKLRNISVLVRSGGPLKVHDRAVRKCWRGVKPSLMCV